MANPKVSHVTSRDNPLLVRLRKLARHPGDYRKLGQVLIEGEHLCAAWAAASPDTVVPQALIAESAWQTGAFALLLGRAAVVAVVADPLLAALSNLETPAPVAFVVPVPERAALDAAAPTVVLDRLQDAGNVGSILRSAAAFGFRQVIALSGTAALWSPKVLRAAMGGHFALSLLEGAANADLDALRMPLLATSSHAAEPVDAADLPDPCAWVFGNEGGGVAPTLEARCRLRVRIRQPGGGESLNVAAAAAICLHESARRRRA